MNRTALHNLQGILLGGQDRRPLQSKILASV